MRKTRILIIVVALMGVTLLSGCTTTGGDKLKAGFIYVGPIGDYGWTNAHDEGRVIVEEKYDWLETVYIESVAENPADVVAAVDTLVEVEKCDIIFTTSFGFMDGTAQAAEKYPDVLFFHCSGYTRDDNMATYFADFYQIYYLNGLMAGALTESDKLGYVGAFPIPEVAPVITTNRPMKSSVHSFSSFEVPFIIATMFDHLYCFRYLRKPINLTTKSSSSASLVNNKSGI